MNEVDPEQQRAHILTKVLAVVLFKARDSFFVESPMEDECIFLAFSA